MALEQIKQIAGTRRARARRRHRHRPHHPRALPAVRDLRRPGRAALLRRALRAATARASSTRSTTRASRGASMLLVGTQLRLRLARASTRPSRIAQGGLPRDHRRELRRDLLRQLHDARHPVPEPRAPGDRGDRRGHRGHDPGPRSRWTWRSSRSVPGGKHYTGSIKQSARDALVRGEWDPIAQLLEGKDAVEEKAKQLPYLTW